MAEVQLDDLLPGEAPHGASPQGPPQQYLPPQEPPSDKEPLEVVVLDTNVVNNLISSRDNLDLEIKLFTQSVYDSHGEDVWCCLSPITVAEITDKNWFAKLSGAQQGIIKKMLDHLDCLEIDHQVGDVFGGLRWKQGGPGSPQENDQWQAALCIYREAILFTFDKNLVNQASHMDLKYLCPQ